MFTNNNIGFLCTDWQVEQGRGGKTALEWLSIDLLIKTYTFDDLQKLTNKAANLLQSQGMEAGDKFMILLPRIPELFIFFLGAMKVGANSCILFNSIGEETLIERILDSNTKFILTNKAFLFKIERIFKALPETTRVLILDEDQSKPQVVGIQRLFENSSEDYQTPLTPKNQSSHFHFTSGSTGKPKAVQHVHSAIENISASFVEVMKPEPDDIFWCTADQGWVTGVSYGIIAPWVNGVTQVQVEGNYNPELWMKVLEDQKVNILYSAPTVFRMLMQQKDSFYSQFNLGKLKRIYCVGEPLNPTIIEWGLKVLGKDVYDTWFQTETGSIMVSNKPGIQIRPGSMGKPLSYIKAAIIDETGKRKPPFEKGLLCISKPWSSMFSEYMNNPQTYQEKFIGNYYSSGDIAFYDKEGYFWFIGRNDDVINTAGHLVSPFEVESSLIEIPEVIDVGVIGVPDDILFEKVIAFVKVNQPDLNLRKLEMTLKLHVAQKVSSIASPKQIIFTDVIPKTKSGKIMRRVLKKRYLGEAEGDLSTLEEF